MIFHVTAPVSCTSMVPLLHNAQRELWLIIPSQAATARRTGSGRRTASNACYTVAPGDYVFMGVHFCWLLLLATTVSMNNMPRTPSSTLGKSVANALGFLPSMAHLTVSAKLE